MPTLPWTTPESALPGVEAAVVMASRLELRSTRHVPGFLRAAMAIRKQALGSPGALGVSLVAQPVRRTFWTLSAWADRAVLDAFVGAEPHRTMMRTYRPRMRGAEFTFYDQPVGSLPPSWEDARRRLAEQSR